LVALVKLQSLEGFVAGGCLND